MFVIVNEDAKPLWSLRGDNIPSALKGVHMKVIDKSSNTYTVMFDENHIYEFLKTDCKEDIACHT